MPFLSRSRSDAWIGRIRAVVPSRSSTVRTRWLITTRTLARLAGGSQFLFPENRSERLDDLDGIAAIRVVVGVEIGHGDSQQVRCGVQRPGEGDQLIPPEPERLRVADGRHYVLVEDIEV